MKRLIILMLLLVLAFTFSLQAQVSIADDTTYQEDYSLDISTPQTPSTLIADGVAKLLAALISFVLGWLCLLIGKYLNIKIMSGQIIGHITREAEKIDDRNISNDAKRDIVVESINKNKKLSKWANILYNTAEGAVSVIYKTIVKKGLKGILR